MKYSGARKELTARLEQLLPQIGKIEAHLASPLEKDSQERSLQLENDEVLEALDDAARKELVQIRGALQRLDDGTFGTCDRCREPISKARLAALPTAELCIQCAEAES